MSTEPRTTIGWIPTAPCMSRGWRTFITTNQPMPIRMSAGSSAPGTKKSATTTGGAHATNGPKNGIAMSTPATTEVRIAERQPEDGLVASATRK